VFIGVLADRIGARRLALGGIWLFGISTATLGLAGPQLWTWYAACAVLAFAGQGVSAVIWASGVAKCFVRQRGLALALAFSGGGIAVALTPSLVVVLVDAVGVRGTFAAIGLGGALLMFVVTLLLFRDRPATPAATATATVALSGHTVPQALRTRHFWQLALALVLTSISIGTFLVHAQPMLTDSGLTPASAATIAFFIGPSMVAGRLLTGTLFDHFNPRLVAATAFAMPFVASALLMSLDGGYLLAAIAGICVGLSIGAEVDVIAYITSRYFGLRSYGVLFAALMSCNGLGIGAGSLLAGGLFDLSGSYVSVLLVLMACSVTATLATALLGAPPAEPAAAKA